ncbi:hypothetical protein niasHT_003125 [Heterodera trifolii]|uniref:G-patch domain-containing protein n=1 Tax=Heterodera trifolii TaxID=157864 RepID=A0ABD2M856_9BILA
MRFYRNNQLPFRHQPDNSDSANRKDYENNSNKGRNDNGNKNSYKEKQRKNESDGEEDEEERTRRRIEQRHLGKGKEKGEKSWTREGEKGTERREEMAKSESILNALIEQVRHRSESSMHSNVPKKWRSEESDGEENGKKRKKHKKKKRQKEKEHNSKKSHRNSKSRDENKEEKQTKRKKKRHRQSDEEEEAKAIQQLRVEIDETKGSRIVTAAKVGDEVPIGADFRFFGFDKEKADGRTADRKSQGRLKFDSNDTESDSDEQSDGALPQKKQPSLANILASAPVSFPWLMALGKAKQSQEEENGGESAKLSEEKAEKSEEKAEQKAEKSEEKTGQILEHTANDKTTEETAKSTKKKSHHRRKRSSSKQSKNSRKRASRSRSRTYSTSPERDHRHEKGRHFRHRIDIPSTSKSPSPLPSFSKQRAFETRRKLIEESWHRRIEHSVRPFEVTQKKGDISGANGIGENEYTDENGRIDKQKLLEIATRNATRLAMEGKLPKGAELVETIKNKSVAQLVDLCKKVQSDRSLALKRHGDASSNSESDEEKRYSNKYEKWRQKEHRREDREFRNRAVRPAGEPARLSRREQREIVQREENTLRLTFPVSSGVKHRIKANAPSPADVPAGPLVRFGDIGPLTTALAKVRTNIPSAYKPLAMPLPLSQPSSTLSSNFQDTSHVQIGPQLPSADCQPNKPLYSDFVPAKTLDCVNQNVYEIALAASARKDEADTRDKTGQTEPLTATSSQPIGPVLPNPAVDSILTASRLLTANNENAAPMPPTTSKSVFSSSWDRPGHIAAREALLKKVAEQKRKEQQEKNVMAKETVCGPGTEKTEQQRTDKEMPTAPNPTQCQMTTNPTSSVPSASPLSDLASAASSSTSPQFSTISISLLSSTLPSQAEAISAPIPPEKQQMSTTTSPNEKTSADGQFKKPALPPATKLAFVLSNSDTPMVLQTTKNPAQTDQRTTNGQKSSETMKKTTGGQGKDFLDRFNTFVEAQVARQKAESALQATILSTAVQQHGPSGGELATFSSSSAFSARPSSAVFSLASSRPDPIGLTKPQRSVQELVAERLRYNQRLQRDPNDYEARRALARVDKEMNSWAQDSSLPGEFTGHTGARVLSEKELEPSDPRFHAWAKKDQFRTAPEINSGIGLKLLQRMGWQPGQGLGRERAGQLEPLALDVKADRKGLFSCLERAPTRESVLDSAGKNPVSVLMEQCARHRWRNPDFSCAESGPHNNRRYLWKAVLNGVEYAPSLPSSNKKAGKAQVCMVILEALGLTTN